MITLKTLSKATAQQVFDQSVIHLLTQNRRALSKGPRPYCIYHAPDGAKCGAGHFISNKEYKESMEHNCPWFVLVRYFQVRTSLHINELINSIQSCHDATSVDNWARELENIAVKYDLNAIAIDRMQAKLKLAKLVKGDIVRHISTNKAFQVNGKLSTSKHHPLQFTLPMKGAPYAINESNMDKWEIMV